MFFCRFSGHLRNWPTLRPLSPCKTLRSTGASFLPLICLPVFPPLPMVAASPELLFTFTVLFWLLFHSCPASSEGVTSWLWTSSPLTAFSILPRLASRVSTATARRVVSTIPAPSFRRLYFRHPLSPHSRRVISTSTTLRRTGLASSWRMSSPPRPPILTGLQSWALLS